MPLEKSALFPRRKFGVCGTTCERPETVYNKIFLKLQIKLPEFKSFSWRMISRCVQVRLSEDNHPDICVEIDFPGLGASEPEVDEVAKPLP